MFEVYKPAKFEMYTPADRDPASLLIRIYRWAFWAAAAVSVSMVLLHGTSLRQNPYARSEWICFFVFNIGNFALSLIERRRKRQNGTVFGLSLREEDLDGPKPGSYSETGSGRDEETF
jgi:hypothetical protein